MSIIGKNTSHKAGHAGVDLSVGVRLNVGATVGSGPFGERTDTLLYRLLLLLVVAVYGTLLMLVMPVIDELLFLNVWKSHSGGDDGFSWSTWMGYVSELRANDNSRLSNILDPVLLQFSPWRDIFPWVTAAMLAFTIAAMAKFSAIRAPRSAVLAYFLAGIIVFLPWRNNMIVWDYALNYIWTGTFALGLMWCVLRLIDGERCFALSILLATLTGWFHEGFAVPVGAGMVVVALMRRGNVSWRYWTVFAVLVVVCSAALFCPGMLNRFGDQAGRQDELNWLIIFVDLCLVPVALLVTGGALFDRGARQRMATPTFVMFFVGMAVSALLSVAILHQPRSAYWPQLCALVCIAIVLRTAFGRFAASVTGRIVAVVLALLTLAQGVTSCVWQYRLKKEYEAIMAEFVAGKKIVYYDIIMPDDIPDFTLRFPTRAVWVTQFQYYCINNYLGGGGRVVVPTSLRNACETNSTPVAGNLGVRRCGNAMWASAESLQGLLRDNKRLFRITLADGTVKFKRGFTHPFVNEHGDALVYVKVFGYDAAAIKEVSVVRLNR